MTLQIGLTDDDLSNTQYAPLAVLLACYRRHQTLKPLKEVEMAVTNGDFSGCDKLSQVLVSILAGCETLSEVNTRLRSEQALAAVSGWSRYLESSWLSRTLDDLTQKQIEQLRQGTTQIWRAHSQIPHHDWRGYLWLEFDLSGLPCSARAQESQKGYFSGKKTAMAGSWDG